MAGWTTPAGCPLAHPQAVGCPQAPQGSTTVDRNKQDKPANPDSHQGRSGFPIGGANTVNPNSFLQSNLAQPSADSKPVTLPKLPVTFAEIRKQGPGRAGRGDASRDQFAGYAARHCEIVPPQSDGWGRAERSEGGNRATGPGRRRDGRPSLPNRTAGRSSPASARIA